MKNICIVFFMFIIASCGKEKNKYVLKEREFVSLIEDLFIADGISMNKARLDESLLLDSLTLYGSVFEKHGITKAHFDTSLAYYIKEPDKLNEIFDEVLNNLKMKELQLREEEIQERAKTRTIWSDNKRYLLPGDGKTNMIPFSKEISENGTYTVSASIRLYPDDESIKPKLKAFFWMKNNNGEEKFDYFKEIYLQKNARNTKVSISKIRDSIPFTHLKGFILHHSNTDSSFIKHAEVLNIKITFTKK